MRKFKILFTILVFALLSISVANFVFAEDRALTKDEEEAFIVRDEWTAWVKGFTASLSELDKNATAKIYDDMDFYDMQYRFTEKYKKVPEYLDEDGKPTQKLKDLIKEKRKKIAGAGAAHDYLKFTSNSAGSTVQYTVNGTISGLNIGISTDGTSFSPWTAGSSKTLNSGESIYIWNKSSGLSTGASNYVKFSVTGNVTVSGDVNSLVNFKENVSNYEYYNLFNGCLGLTNSTNLNLTSKVVNNLSYSRMFYGCTSLTGGPYIKATSTNGINVFNEMFTGCSSLNSIKLDWTGTFDSDVFEGWASSVGSSGTLYYNGTDTTTGSSGIPTGWTVQSF